MTKVEDLTLQELNLLVAKLERIKVMIYRNHVAEELAFNPEGESNAYDLKTYKMWRYYEPTSDWRITGPILDRERISVVTTDFGFHVGSCRGYEQRGATAAEAVIRSYVQAQLGDKIDLSQEAPLHEAVVRIIGVTWEDDKYLEQTFVDDFYRVKARTTQEAEELAKLEHYPDTDSIKAYFVRWE